MRNCGQKTPPVGWAGVAAKQILLTDQRENVSASAHSSRTAPDRSDLNVACQMQHRSTCQNSINPND